MSEYARNVVGALVEAIVPATPDLGEEVDDAVDGDTRTPGALDAGVDEYVLNVLGDDAPVVAAVLDAAAVELVARRRREDALSLREGPRTPFASLSPRDRLRAVTLIEEGGTLPWLEERLGDDAGTLAELREVPHLLHVLVQAAYYGGATVDRERREAGDVPAWEQVGYPGPTEGYAALRGYEVDEFVEDEY